MLHLHHIIDSKIIHRHTISLLMLWITRDRMIGPCLMLGIIQDTVVDTTHEVPHSTVDVLMPRTCPLSMGVRLQLMRAMGAKLQFVRAMGARHQFVRAMGVRLQFVRVCTTMNRKVINRRVEVLTIRVVMGCLRLVLVRVIISRLWVGVEAEGHHNRIIIGDRLSFVFFIADLPYGCHDR